MRVDIQPEVLRWARERAGLNVAALTKRFPKYATWELGEQFPTLKQVEAFAKATYTPLGFLFLDAPPTEQVPIPDFRTPGLAHRAHPSANLLDTIYICQQRQEWYRDFARSMGEDPLPFDGAALPTSAIDKHQRSQRIRHRETAKLLGVQVSIIVIHHHSAAHDQYPQCISLLNKQA